MKYGNLSVVLLLAACGGSSRPKSPTVAPTPSAQPSELTNAIPCFPGRTTLITGQEATKALIRYSAQNDEYTDETETGTWGTCNIADANVRDPGGRLVAQINCGVDFYVPGFVDSHGITLGALGRDVRARAGAERNLLCLGNGPGQTRCRLVRESEDGNDGNSYTFSGDLPDDVLQSDTAWDWISDRAVIVIGESYNCH